MNEIQETLADKLRSLGVHTGANDIMTPQKIQAGIENVVDGQFIETSFGEVFCSKILCDNAYAHGFVEFKETPINNRFIQWADPSCTKNTIDLSSILFLDTETTGLSGGTGTIPFMIGLGHFTTDGFVTSQIFIRNPAEERAQLELFDRMLNGINTIVTYNGKTFDAPILQSRYILNGLPSPLKGLIHFDLLPISRRLWRRRLESRSLKDIETEILGYSRNQMEVPGWEIPVLYFNFLRTHDPRPLAGVFYHNAIDIQSLAALFLLMNSWAGEPEILLNRETVDLFSIAIQLELSGEIDKAIALYEQLLTSDLPEKHFPELQLRYAKILKRNGNYSHAVDVLHVEQSQKDIRVMIQLAKVMEHQRRDHISALEWTNKALEQLETSTSIVSEQYISNQKSDLQKRKDRLIQKLKISDNS